jgi:hypothetical protein
MAFFWESPDKIPAGQNLLLVITLREVFTATAR